jgi:hypothetical protein
MKLTKNREKAMRLCFTALCVLVTAQAGAATPSASSVRVCLVSPRAQIPGVSADESAAAVRDAFKSFLTGPNLGVEVLSARLTSQAREEAKQKDCRYVLYTTVTQERKMKSGLLGRIAAGAVESGASQVAANAGSTGTRVLARAAAGGAGSAYYSSFTRSSDKLTLTARLESADGSVLSQSSEKRKANSDGEDLLTPLVERVAERIVTAVSGVAP